ncbi:MAG: hypothetical protein RL095_3013 [Verrucomicrobiota bacterium]|jgi:signal recognition particle subunit SRP54
MFDNLSNSLQRAFRGLTGRGVISASNIRDAMEEIRAALLTADVSYDIANQLVETIAKKAVGEEVLRSITPGQQVVKIVHDELVKLMGESDAHLSLPKTPSVILMVGLHGAGKTTTAAKLGLLLRKQNKHVMLAACDVYRPAAIDQLEALGRQMAIPVHAERGASDVVSIAQNAYKEAKAKGCQALIVDTAGRLQLDKDMIDEVIRLKAALGPSEILLVADAALGQQAVSVATTFDQALGLTGIVLTKLDGDARGGAALSMRQATGKPIKFIGTGEKPGDFERFRPEGMAQRILGMGDVVSLVEQAEMMIKEEEAKRLEQKMRENTFDLNDFLGQMAQLRAMGGFRKILERLPGGAQLKDLNIDDKQMKGIEAIIQSMTADERRLPEIINAGRRNRIAKGSGCTVDKVNELIKRFNMAREMMGKVARGQSPIPGLPSLPGTSSTKAKKLSAKDKKAKKK